MNSTDNKTIILEGAPTAKSIIDKLTNKILTYTTAGKRKPALAVILVGQDPASSVYVKNKIRACEDIGIESSFAALRQHR